MRYDELFIGGAWCKPSTDQRIKIVSPHTEVRVAQVAAAAPADVDVAVQSARTAFDDGPWPRTTPTERIDAVRGLAEIYGGRRADMAA